MWEWEAFELVFASSILVLAIVLGFRAVARPQDISLFDVVFLSSGMFFGLGSWVAFYYGRSSLPYAEPQLLFEAFFTIALYLLGIFCLRLVFENWLSRVRNDLARYSLKELIDCFRRVAIPTIVVAAAVLWFARIHRGLIHEIWFSGTDDEEALSAIPYYWIVIYSLAFCLGYGCLLWSVRAFWEDNSRWTRLTAGSLIVLEFGWMFLSGRRWLIEWMIFVSVGYFTSGRRLNWKIALIGAAALGLMVAFFFPLFLNIRVLYQSGIAADENALGRFFSLLIEALNTDRDTSRTIENENLSERPLIHRFICEIREGQRTHPLMMGEALLTSFLWAIPSALLAAKLDLLQTEQFIQAWYGMPLDDTSITWPAVGCADFGLGGGFIVGLLVGVILVGTQWLSRHVRQGFPFIVMCLIGGLTDALFQVELDPTSYWILFRNVLILGVIAKVIHVLATAGSSQPAPAN